MSIFVFGSNENGRHAGGSSQKARESYGAVDGQMYGRQGNAFGIPTRDKRGTSLGVSKILPYVRGFLEYAKNNSTETFEVPNIGCGQAKYPLDFMAPLFVGYTPNVHFIDPDFQTLITSPVARTRLMVASSKEFEDHEKLWAITEKLTHLYDLKDFELIPAMEGLGARLMSGWAKKKNIPIHTFKPQWTRVDSPTASKKISNGNEINAAAIFDKNAWSLAYATDLLVLDNYTSKEIKGLMTTASQSFLNSILYIGSSEQTQQPSRNPNQNTSY
jgi:hypothetical protein